MIFIIYSILPHLITFFHNIDQDTIAKTTALKSNGDKDECETLRDSLDDFFATEVFVEIASLFTHRHSDFFTWVRSI